MGSSFDPDTIISMEIGEPSSLDPATAYDASSLEVVQNVYQTLVSYNGNESMPSNCLATGADVSADGLTYRIYLRSGVKFQDGTDFNADAVKYSFDRGVIMNQDPWRMSITPHLLGGQEYIATGDAAQYLAHDTVQVINSTCVQIHLAAPYTGSVFLFAFPATAIISPAYDMANGGYSPNVPSSFMDRHMCGTGPYRFVSWAPGNCVVLKKNDAYWGTQALTQNVVIRYVPDYTTRLNAINSGSADLIWASALNTPDLGNPNVVVESGRPTLSVNALCFNLARWRFDDKRVRQAFVESFDDGTYVDSALNGYGRRVNGPIPQYIDGHDNDIPIYQFDPEHARQLLVDAGFSKSTPTTVNLYYNNGNEVRRIACELLKKQIESYDLGITVQVTPLDWSTYLSRQDAGDMDMYAVGTMADYPSADACLAPYVPNGYYGSRIGYVNDSVTALYQQALAETDPVRSQLIGQIVSGMDADYAYIWLSNAIQFQPHRIELRGYTYNPADTGLRFASMYKDNSVPSYTFDLKEGWNLVSLPVDNTMFTASGLGATNPYITDIVMFDQATGEYKIFMVGLSPAAYDFQLLPDNGYFVNCADDTTLTVNGKPPSLRSTDLQPGWNLVGWGTYHDTDAKSLCEMLDGTQDIVRYDRATGEYQVYMEGLSPSTYDFNNGPGEGYFINTDSHRTLRYGVI
ncbi:ABC transporter substrate binding protein [Methanocella paludicola SANAE]|uniref:ABC transporter substrate binding protein n=2 Tax=Methanocella TaxID=570266 RepID=D1YZM3_METPS|nr:ABC transporter substrate binding protein [Methanocella paludicola SANAE]